MSVSRGDTITQTQMNSLASIANVALSPSTPYQFATTGGWLSELNRIRRDFYALFGFPSSINTFPFGGTGVGFTQRSDAMDLSNAPALLVPPTTSGPWVVSLYTNGGILENSSILNYNGVEIWIPANENLISGSAFASTYDIRSPATRVGSMSNLLNNFNYSYRSVGTGVTSTPITGSLSKTWKSKFRIGGDTSGILSTVDGGYTSGFQIRARNQYPPNIDVTTDIPGAIITTRIDNGGYVSVDIPSSPLAPGVYTIEASIAGPSDDWVWFEKNSIYGIYAGAFKWTISGTPIKETATGIHQSGVAKYRMFSPSFSESWPFGLYFLTSNFVGPYSYNPNECILDAVDGVLFYPSGVSPYYYSIGKSRTYWTGSSSVGVFVASTIPVGKEAAETDTYMPFTRIVVGGEQSTMRRKAPSTDTSEVKGVTPSINYRLGRFPATKDYNFTIGPLGYPTVDLRGLCIYEICARRQAEKNSFDMYLPPTGIMPEMKINIGLSGVGGFSLLKQMTIPSGQMETKENVFWPVLSSFDLLRYYIEDNPISGDVMVHAFANDMRGVVGNMQYLPNCTYPISASLYNDIYNALSFINP